MGACIRIFLTKTASVVEFRSAMDATKTPFARLMKSSTRHSLIGLGWCQKAHLPRPKSKREAHLVVIVILRVEMQNSTYVVEIIAFNDLVSILC